MPFTPCIFLIFSILWVSFSLLLLARPFSALTMNNLLEGIRMDLSQASVITTSGVICTLAVCFNIQVNKLTRRLGVSEANNTAFCFLPDVRLCLSETYLIFPTAMYGRYIQNELKCTVLSDTFATLQLGAGSGFCLWATSFTLLSSAVQHPSQLV